jgi:hypothetical protein
LSSLPVIQVIPDAEEFQLRSDVLHLLLAGFCDAQHNQFQRHRQDNLGAMNHQAGPDIALNRA